VAVMCAKDYEIVEKTLALAVGCCWLYHVYVRSLCKEPTTGNSAVLLPTSGNRALNTLSQLAANHVSSTSAQLSIACGPASQ